MGWLSYLFDSSGFGPPGALGEAGAWDDFHKLMFISSCAGVAFLKMTTPVIWILLWLPVMRMQPFDCTKLWELRQPAFKAACVYGGFIFMTGVGRFFNDVVAWWWPAYRFYAWLYFFSFIAGVAATYYMV